MSEENIQVEIITPTSKVYSGSVESFIAPGVEGYFGVLPRHAPYVVAMQVGEIKLKGVGDANLQRFATSGGFAEILPHKITVLAETAESAANIDVNRAENAISRAKKRIEEGRKTWDIDRAHAALARGFNRMAIAKKKL
ncbi:MAG: F0F1 ATP synthase subunit epsilon [Deferribacteres bacterium]|nr:F0F1 ATP synthase subunit epsilon [candidate division KSB1 bacterium]MCB9502985.1 F0F1 ATP synthase subunit epsilon [Deferribacteres bacterium]